IIEAGFLSRHPLLFNYFIYATIINQAIYFWFLFFLLKDIGVEKQRLLIRRYGVFLILACIIIFSISVFNFKVAIKLNSYYSMVNSVFVVVFFVMLFKKVPATIKILLTGSLFVVIGGAGTVISNLIDISVAHMSYYQAGFFIELIFFTVAVNFMHYNDRMDIIKTKLNNSILEAKNLKKENETRLLEEELNLKNRDLATKAMMISQKENLLKSVSDKLKNEIEENKDSNSGIQKIVYDLGLKDYYNYWDEFEIHFTKVHPDFYKNLNNKYPGLTANERKICAFIKLNMSTKDIANITKKSPQSIIMARYRLRKKMGLNKNANLDIEMAGIN
ncbi:MAG: hypothetical protein JXR31_01955, partial [Prolixibacteraceae bacterium]|nr:hypothetical protein [Prolixibacteraceae bacterium]